MYNYSLRTLQTNVKKLIKNYSAELEHANKEGASFSPTHDSSAIAWSRGLRKRFANGVDISYSKSSHAVAAYRPFCKQIAYVSRDLVEYPGQHLSYFPLVGGIKNKVIVYSGARGPSCIITDSISDKHYLADS